MFDQIILKSPKNDASWEHILGGRVLPNVKVQDMDKSYDQSKIDSRSVVEYLEYKKDERARIAIILTFSDSGHSSDIAGSTELSKEVNRVFFCSFSPQPAEGPGEDTCADVLPAKELSAFQDFFVQGAQATWVERSEGYFSQTYLEANESRIGIFFVTQVGDCP